MSTETRDALREALARAIQWEETPDGSILPPIQPFIERADAILAHPAMVAALRAPDVPVAEGLRGCPPGECTHCDRDRAFTASEPDA